MVAATSVARRGLPPVHWWQARAKSGSGGAPNRRSSRVATPASESGPGVMVSAFGSAARAASRPASSRSPTRAATTTAIGSVSIHGATRSRARSVSGSHHCASSIAIATGPAAARSTSSRSSSPGASPSTGAPSPRRLLVTSCQVPQSRQNPVVGGTLHPGRPGAEDPEPTPAREADRLVDQGRLPHPRRGRDEDEPAASFPGERERLPQPPKLRRPLDDLSRTRPRAHRQILPPRSLRGARSPHSRS